MEKPQVVALIVLDESDDEEDVVQIRTIGASSCTGDAVTTRPLGEQANVPAVDLDALATQQELDSSRDEEYDFISWPFRHRNKPAATSPSARAAAAAEARMAAANFLALDEEELLSDLFGSVSGDAKNHSKSESVRTKKKKQQQRELEGASAEQPARKLRKTRSRERGVTHPKLKPLEIIGGEAKSAVKAPASPAAHDALEDSVEDVDGEECPLCGQRFSTDVLQAHVEAELEQGNTTSTVTSSSDRAAAARPLLVRGRSGAGVEVVVLEDDNDAEEIASSGETAECPFCQRRFRQGVELEEHVQHEVAVREACGDRVATSRVGDVSRTKAPATRPPLPLLRQHSRNLPSSFGAGAATGGTLSPYLTKRSQSRPPSSPPPPASASPAALAPDSQSTVGGEEEDGEDEDNYADVTFNFQPLWASQALPYDYQNQFDRQKKKRGAGRGKTAYVQEEEEDQGDVEEIEEVAPPAKRGAFRGRGSSSTSGKSWRGARRGGRGRDRGKRGR